MARNCCMDPATEWLEATIQIIKYLNIEASIIKLPLPNPFWKIIALRKKWTI